MTVIDDKSRLVSLKSHETCLVFSADARRKSIQNKNGIDMFLANFPITDENKHPIIGLGKSYKSGLMWSMLIMSSSEGIQILGSKLLYSQFPHFICVTSSMVFPLLNVYNYFIYRLSFVIIL